MPDLDFSVESIAPEQHSAAPLLLFRIAIAQSNGQTPIHTIALRSQIRIEPARRHYSDDEAARLFELFGPRSQWGQSMRSTLWTHATAMVPPFTGNTVADLPVPCTFDFNVAMTKYFGALDDGEAPIALLFSGTIFYQTDSGALQAAPISWEKEATARLPISVWRQMMDQHYPNTAWLCLAKPVFDKLNAYRQSARHITWEQAIEDLLEAKQ